MKDANKSMVLRANETASKLSTDMEYLLGRLKAAEKLIVRSADGYLLSIHEKDFEAWEELVKVKDISQL